jgi:hypothetical protein
MWNACIETLILLKLNYGHISLSNNQFCFAVETKSMKERKTVKKLNINIRCKIISFENIALSLCSLAWKSLLLCVNAFQQFDDKVMFN